MTWSKETKGLMGFEPGNCGIRGDALTTEPNKGQISRKVFCMAFNTNGTFKSSRWSVETSSRQTSNKHHALPADANSPHILNPICSFIFPNIMSTNNTNLFMK